MVHEAASYQPTEGEQVRGREAYIRYVLGAVTIHDPTKTQELHNRDLTYDYDVRIILLYAENLMLNGLRGVIRNANAPDEEGRRSLVLLEGQFDTALPNMQATVERAYQEEADRLRELNAGLNWLRPAPMTDRVLYGYLCKRVSKVKTLRLMDSLMPSDVFTPLLPGRTLSYLAGAETEYPLLLAGEDEIS